MNLYYKYYTADVIVDGLVEGNIVARVPFYRSAMQAFRIMRKEQHTVFNFRRVE
jgi:hypothetical protein